MKRKIIHIMNVFKHFIDKQCFNSDYVSKFNNSKNKKLFLIGTPTHGNLGDQAIAIAEILFIKEYFSDYTLFEITYDEVYIAYRALKKYIKSDDLIFMHGGGNLGDLYIEEENIRRLIISNFKKNCIFVFPQTIDFKNNNQLKKSLKIYSEHKNLVICGREKVSFDIMSQNFVNNKILLIPDIVLFLSGNYVHLSKQYILTCFRRDEEKKLSPLESKIIDDYIVEYSFKNDIKCINTDTVVPNSILPKDRNKFVENKLKQFSNAKIVITDRLHGMVFAALTQTPCIVFGNYNHKVKGVYNWLNQLNYIVYLNDVTKFEEEFNRLISLKDFTPCLSFDEEFSYINSYLRGV